MAVNIKTELKTSGKNGMPAFRTKTNFLNLMMIPVYVLCEKAPFFATYLLPLTPFG